ncbi:MAG: hypothetical protein NC489_19070 [Ruminococcus flavefaciens]|nr:hypothetical protein [Ruminococcus flavefaciens]
MTNLTIGQQVTNFGITATVVEFHPITGQPVLFAEGIGKWIADPAKCEAAAVPVAYRTGLVVFG